MYSQGDTFEEARENLIEVIELTLETAPAKFTGRKRRRTIPPGTVSETFFLILPREAA